MMPDLKRLARQLGGDVAGRATVLMPGPGHSKRDRSLSVTFDDSAPDGFLVHSFAGDRFEDCRDHVKRLLGIDGTRDSVPARREREVTRHNAADASALAIWKETVAIGGTLAEQYLATRKLRLFDGAQDLRFHPSCPFGTDRHPCMVALFRDIHTDEPKAIHRTALTAIGGKIGRKMLGPKSGAAIKLSAHDQVESGLTIAEGIETALAAAAFGFRPIWAVGDAGGIEKFPVLAGVDALTIIVDNDASLTGQGAAETCSKRWTDAGREVLRVLPNATGADIADLAA